jgi:protein TonB
MQVRFIVAAALTHGAIIVGAGLGVGRSVVPERRPVELVMLFEPPSVAVPAEPVLPEPVPVETLPEAEFEESPVAEAPLPEARDQERADDAPPQTEDEARFYVPERLRPGPELLLRLRREVVDPVVPVVPVVPEPEVVSPPAAVDRSSSAVEALDEQNRPPRYPALAQRLGLEADVVLMVTVNPRGEVSNVELIQSAGHNRAAKQLDRAAIAAICQWRYRPAMRDGRAVEARVRVPVHFRIR